MHSFLSIDVGGTTIKYALLNNAGQITKKDKVPTPTSSLTEFMKSIYAIIDQYQPEISGLAVCVPGKVDPKNEVVVFSDTLPFLKGWDLPKLFKEHYRKILPIIVENEGRAAALAESWLGNLHGETDAAAILLGTDISSGIITNGQLNYGAHAGAGMLNFVPTNFKAEGTDRLAGFNGSSVKMIQDVIKASGLPEGADGQAAFRMIEAGNPDAAKVFNEYCYQIACLILSMQAIVDLNKVVIGGGISAQPVLIKTINDQYDQLVDSMPIVKKEIVKPKIEPAKFKNDANLYGALDALLLKLDEQN
ncbi:ROK family protein [Limosilactobacillus mucosae]|uniref:ROK family protein n=1 Tax=Limosilactobacillus mucosae TaxID=97478 RepID=UPI00233EDE31|nr:ROK family protein [Limosilactobacillus mucosae]MDC2841730.1 ROK family protein [Limosilactobacillus mucosae]